MDVVKAILYELQPFTYKDVTHYRKKAKLLLKEATTLGAAIKSPQLSSLNIISLSSAVKLLLWFMAWRAFVYVDFGSFFVVITGIALIFLNLGERKDGELSAYSVFNRGQQRMMGTLTADQFEREIMHHHNYDDNTPD